MKQVLYSILLAAVLTIGSCTPKNYSNALIDSTAYDFPELNIPKDYYLDSLSEYDSITSSNYFIYFLQSKDGVQSQFNSSIRNTVIQEIADDKSVLEIRNPDELYAYSYFAQPITIYSNQDLISITSVIDTYTEGGNHHNYNTQTFSYDLLRNRIIQFNDVFSIQSEQDSIEFINYLEHNTLKGCTDSWGYVYSNIDFSFCKEGITISPNLSWACSGTISIIPMDSTNTFLRNEWVK